MPIRVLAVLVVLALSLPALAAELPSSQDGPPDAPKLHWEVAPAKGARSTDKRAKTFRLAGFRLVEAGGKVRWKAQLPKRFERHAVVMDKVAEGTHKQSPWLVWPVRDAVTGASIIDDTVVVADPAGLLVLDARTGAVLVDWEDPNTADAGGRPLAFDTARYTFGRLGATDCGGRAAKGRVLARCGDELIYFNGTTAALVSLVQPAEPTTVRYEYGKHFKRGADAFRFGATLPLVDAELHIEGAIAGN